MREGGREGEEGREGGGRKGERGKEGGRGGVSESVSE